MLLQAGGAGGVRAVGAETRQLLLQHRSIADGALDEALPQGACLGFLVRFRVDLQFAALVSPPLPVAFELALFGLKVPLFGLKVPLVGLKVPLFGLKVPLSGLKVLLVVVDAIDDWLYFWAELDVAYSGVLGQLTRCEHYVDWALRHFSLHL